MPLKRARRMVDIGLEEFEATFEIDLDEAVTQEEIDKAAKEIEELKKE